MGERKKRLSDAHERKGAAETEEEGGKAYLTEGPDAHLMSVSDAADLLDTDLQNGLSEAEAKIRLEQYGPNSLAEEESTSLWELVLEQFDDTLVQILLVSAVFSFVIAYFEENEHEGWTAYVEPFVILLILIINAVVGVWQESNAESALEALKNLQPQFTTVIRDGEMKDEFPVSDVVPGDVVLVNEGDKVPADCRLTQLLTTVLRVDESMVTGEPKTIMKFTHAIEARKNGRAVRVVDRNNIVFSGTNVQSGRARAVVIKTGMKSYVGSIQHDVSSSEEAKSPLKIKLDKFSDLLTYVIAFICLLVWVINYQQFFDPVHGGWVKGCLYYLKIAVALGVAAIPEGLPAVITLCLALGTRKMVKRNAIIRKLKSVETLGCTNVICSDKTGTLTQNEMTVVRMAIFGNSTKSVRDENVLGTSYNPEGSVENLEELTEDDVAAVTFARICSLCNDARIRYKEEEDRYQVFGQPTEGALKVLAEKMGMPNGEPSHDWSKTEMADTVSRYYERGVDKVATLGFSRGKRKERMSMSVLVRDVDGDNEDAYLLVKGAPDRLLARCNRVLLQDGSERDITPTLRRRLQALIEDMSGQPLRVLACAIKRDLEPALCEYTGEEKDEGHSILAVDPDELVHVESDMVFVGLAGIKDPARPEVKDSVTSCKKAGIRVVMITGDVQETADAIAREIGIFGEDEDIEGKSFMGEDFMVLPEEEQLQLLAGSGGRVFARTSPSEKKELVELFKKLNYVAAMTGDGVNDAPALKAANIGVAMGISGTEVAKEASDMVLADDNFATIVAAVEEGRAIYNNMKAFIRYLISSNIGEVASIFLTAILGIPEGLIPVQLLWVNLVTDGPPATALGFNPADEDIMERPPRSKDEDLITGWVFFRYMVVGLYVGFATVGVFIYWYMWYDWADDQHSLVTYDQLSHWGQCPNWEGFSVKPYGGMTFEDPCTYFTKGKIAASTLSLTVLVTIEMFNALNALSEDGSLFQMPPWVNPWLLVAMFISFALHFVILYIPVLADIFSIVPLTANDWLLVFYFSFPVIVIDEVLKFIGRVTRGNEHSKIKQD